MNKKSALSFKSFAVASLGIALLALSACGKGGPGKLDRGAQESYVVLNDEDVPMRPTDLDHDPLDDLNPDLEYRDENTGTDQTQTPTPVPSPSPIPPLPATPEEEQQPPLDIPPVPTPKTKSPQRPPTPSPGPSAPPVVSPPTASPTPPPPVRIRGFWDEKNKDGRNWSSHTVNAIGKYGRALIKSVPEDIESFCPPYPKLSARDRLDFWVKLISALAAAESSFDPTCKYTEPFRDKSGKNVISRGLLQLSIESSLMYDCDLESAQDLHDPQKNLECGVRIMSRWITRDGRIAGNNGDDWLGIGRYWSPFRSDSRKFEKIRGLLRKVPVCR